MYDVYFWTTPNGYKVTILLEELGLAHTYKPVNISKGEQFAPDFLKIAPNNRIPALVDHDPADGGDPVSVFESGAILWYLAEKHGAFLPTQIRARAQVQEWLMWQMGGLGPMCGQNHHFTQYAPEPVPYAIDRYVKETGRLYGVMNKRLAEREYLADAYSIADIACYPWVQRWPRQRISLDDFPHVKRWFEMLGQRPAVQKAYARGDEINTAPAVTEEGKKLLFGQDASTVR